MAEKKPVQDVGTLNILRCIKMKEQIILTITQEMLPVLDNAQLMRLQKVLEKTLCNVEIKETAEFSDDRSSDNEGLLTAFINAKRIEGCSEKTLKYYKATINKMISETNISITKITTDHLRKYLADYQKINNCGNTTVDNIRRNLSSFFS